MIEEQAEFFKSGGIGEGAMAASPRTSPPDGIPPRPHVTHC
jgi:hypothetical protein